VLEALFGWVLTPINKLVDLVRKSPLPHSSVIKLQCSTTSLLFSYNVKTFYRYHKGPRHNILTHRERSRWSL
jgi:hypothetical protein